MAMRTAYWMEKILRGRCRYFFLSPCLNCFWSPSVRDRTMVTDPILCCCECKNTVLDQVWVPKINGPPWRGEPGDEVFPPFTTITIDTRITNAALCYIQKKNPWLLTSTWPYLAGHFGQPTTRPNLMRLQGQNCSAETPKLLNIIQGAVTTSLQFSQLGYTLTSIFSLPITQSP